MKKPMTQDEYVRWVWETQSTWGIRRKQKLIRRCLWDRAGPAPAGTQQPVPLQRHRPGEVIDASDIAFNHASSIGDASAGVKERWT